MYHSRKIKQLIDLFESRFKAPPILILKIRETKNSPPCILLISQNSKIPEDEKKMLVKQGMEIFTLKEFNVSAYVEPKELLRNRFHLEPNDCNVLIYIPTDNFDYRNIIYLGIQMTVLKAISENQKNARCFAKILKENNIEIETSIYKPNPTP